MKRKEKLPELLSPAGDFEALIAAVSGGADAVYVGGKSFGARAYAKNFDTDELKKAALYCHIHSVKLYVTVNTLIYDKEISEVVEYAKLLRDIGADALIMADLGAIRAVRRAVPELEIHASTQMSVHSSHGADEAYALGCKRVVLARELSLADISKTVESCLPEVEIFLHGALCVCHSGQCLMSSLVGGRSGNRGECAQPCRLPYGGKYPLSLSDLSLALHIPELIGSGVASLKIEGRMKSPDYVYTVTSIYRRLLDEGRVATRAELDALQSAFSRGKFTDGYFTARHTEKMTGVRSEDDKNATRAAEKRVFLPEKLGISASLSIKRDKPAELSLSLGERCVTVFGEVPSEAISHPLLKDELLLNISKLGDSYFTLNAENAKIELDGGLNLSRAQLNALRRSAVAALEAEFMPRREIFAPENAEGASQKHVSDGIAASKEHDGDMSFSRRKIRTAQFFLPDVFAALAKESPKSLSYFDAVFLPLPYLSELEVLPRIDAEIGAYIPPIVTDSERESVLSMMSAAKALGVTHALVGNIGHIALARSFGFKMIGDFRLNIFNSETAAQYADLGIENAVLSPELTLPMARDIGGGEIVYGRIPLMLTERCFIKENFGCKNCNKAALKDRTGAEFPMLREYQHRNIILNSAPTYMADKGSELSAAGISHRHFLFTLETAAEVRAVIRMFESGAKWSAKAPFRRIGKRESTKK